MSLGPRLIMPMALALLPVSLPAQRLQSQFANATENALFDAPSMAISARDEVRPSRGPYLLGGALVGGALAVLTIGPALVRAEIGSEPLIYALSAASGALLGLFIGHIVYEVRYGT